MTKRPMPTLAELIAMTPGAQSREQAQASMKRRRQRRETAQEPPAPTEDFAARETMPIVDKPDAFGKDFWTRFATKDKPPPRGSKPRLVAKNEAIKKKKKPGTDDPEPPKAA